MQPPRLPEESISCRLTDSRLSWAEVAIQVNHSADENPLLLLSTSPLLPPQVFPYIMSQITAKHRKSLILEALLRYIPSALPTKPLHITSHLTSGALSASSPLVLYRYPGHLKGCRYLHMQSGTKSEPFSAFWNTQSYLQNPKQIH